MKPTLTPAAAAITHIDELAAKADYSLLDTLNCDPDARDNGNDFTPRQVFSGHYVPVAPTPLADAEYVSHSPTFFRELNFDDQLAHTDNFRRIFSGDLSQAPTPMRNTGWATGYALSIYGTEYTQQCPFGTGNGYGDGRAISVLEAVINGQRWEMQLKGAGRTPYCRGADGRAVLRSSIREFLAQEHMYALGVNSTRSLCLFVSTSQIAHRPWYSENAITFDPDIMVAEPVAISTRVAPSFLRVGQIELFGRRARKAEHPEATHELKIIVQHLIKREYSNEIDSSLPLPEQVLLLLQAFCERLTSLIADWLRVGYCQGNFNSDNCAAGGFTLDYGPFGFCEQFDPHFQPWTGGGRHFSFFNQPIAANTNFHMLCTALKPLMDNYPEYLDKFDDIRQCFPEIMLEKMDKMWAAKLGLEQLDEALFRQLIALMQKTAVDYTIFFRELSHIPDNIEPLRKSFYQPSTPTQDEEWSTWLDNWRSLALANQDSAILSQDMLKVNPKYTWREWLIAPAYQRAKEGDYSLVKELQEVLDHPYNEQSKAIEDKYYQLRPSALSQAGGISHYSCSS